MASKFSEIDDNLLQTADIQDYLKPYTNIRFHDITRSELIILDMMKWSMHRVMPNEFVQIFNKIGLLTENDSIHEDVL
jgi:hypothetical protein